MTTLQTLLAHPAVVATGWAILHLLWQGAIVVAIAAALLRIFRDSSSNVRYLIASGALAAMVAMPLVTAARLYDPAAPRPEPAPVSELAGIVIPTSTPGHSVTIPIPTSRAFARVLFQPLVPWTFALWLAGVLLLASRLAFGWARLRRICRAAAAVNEQLASTVRTLAGRMGLTRRVRVAVSDSFDVPVVFGWLRPVLLFPVSALSGLTPQQIETIAAHELAHIRRHDAVVNLLQTAVETLLFYHPGVWWLSARIRAERENCCDDIVVDLCGDAVLYARALTELEQLRAAPAYAVAATGGSLRERVLRLVGAGSAPRPSHRLVAGLACAAVLIAVLIIAPLSLLAQKAPSREVVPGSTITVTAPSDESASPDPDAEPVAYAYAFQTGEDNESTFDVDFDQVLDVDVDADMDVDIDDEGVFKDDGVLSVDELVHLRNAGVTAAFAEEIKKAGYDVTMAQLVAMATHGVDGEFIAAMNGAGFGKLSLEQLVAARIHDLTPAFIQDARRRFGAIPFEQIATLALHDVNGTFIDQMNAAGFGKLSFEQLVAARIHDLTPALIRDARQRFGSIPFEQVATLAVHDVNGEFIDAMNAAGFGTLSLQQLVAARIHGLSPEFVRDARQRFGDLAFDKVLALAMHGVDDDYLRDLADAGIKTANVDQILQLATMGVDADYIESMRAAGFRDASLEDLVRMKSHGVDAEYVRDLEKLKTKNK